jgi:hypothetical protein
MAYTQSMKKEGTAKPPETVAMVSSSFLQSATYDADNFSLTLDFKNVSQVVYRFVFPVVWQQFKEQPSHGKFYSQSIKGKYPSVNFRMPMKISDLNRAMRENRPNANKHKAAAR